MQITLKGLTGKTFPLNVDPSDDVRDVKNKIAQTYGMPSDQQRLHYNGQHLEDGRTMGDYNVHNGDTVYLILRLRGG